ncbi:MAG: phosphotransferase [Gammaproteobacteria bacterium]|nr:phosphotransferase [Gammaproteobacteria bacterium]
MTDSSEHSNSAGDRRLTALREWLRPRFGDVDLLPASADASFRRYFRFHHDGDSFIVMDAPPGQEDSRPFVDIAGRLAAAGVHVPDILATDFDQGFLLLSDLGDSAYLQALNESNAAPAVRRRYFRRFSQCRTAADDRGLPIYDHERLMQELRLFPEWYLRRHLQIEPDSDEAALLNEMFALLVERALQQPRVFVHRDYMPRNLMVSCPNPGVLDFQDAVSGPISYDPVCLFRDAFISWPQPRVTEWLRDYWLRARDRGLPVPPAWEDFQVDLDWMGLQRHLKVLGIFARICYRDGKPHYLEDAPRFIGYIMEVLPHYPQLAPLRHLFEQRVLPATAAGGVAG